MENSYLYVTIILSFFVCLIIILTNSIHGKWTNDDFEGVQKIHHNPTPRIGGISIIISLFAYYFIFYETDQILYKYILISSIPIIISGILEDITKKITPLFRFICSITSGFIFIYLTEISLTSIGIIGIDQLLSYYIISVMFTIFCISGLTNSINIIDGFNGLASGSNMIMMATFLYISLAHNDHLISSLCTVFILSNIGFLIFNFPFGKIFLGDGGAYFSGFFLSIIAILLPERNAEISPWVSLLVCSYPIFETIVSMYRKTKRKGHHFSKPDKLHLHMLVYRDVSRKYSKKYFNLNFRNPLTSIIMWTFPLICSICAMLFYKQKILIILFIVSIFYLYLKFYIKLSLNK